MFSNTKSPARIIFALPFSLPATTATSTQLKSLRSIPPIRKCPPTTLPETNITQISSGNNQPVPVTVFEPEQISGKSFPVFAQCGSGKYLFQGVVNEAD